MITKLKRSPGLYLVGFMAAGKTTVGKALGMRQAMKSGIGSFTVTLPGGVLVAALAAVNAYGDVRDPATGKIIAGARKSASSRDFADSNEVLKSRGSGAGLGAANTTLVVVATNARLNKVETNKLAQFGPLPAAVSTSHQCGHRPSIVGNLHSIIQSIKRSSHHQSTFLKRATV